MEAIAKDFGVRRYNWLVYKEKKDKEEEQRHKELIKGDPSIVREPHFILFADQITS
jgi:splicing factor, arginine/serine-rich 16